MGRKIVLKKFHAEEFLINLYYLAGHEEIHVSAEGRTRIRGRVKRTRGTGPKAGGGLRGRKSNANDILTFYNI